VPRFGRVVLGGTFDRLHVGHEALLASAFRQGRTVAIGVTTDGYLTRHPKPLGPRIAPYRARRAALVRWLAARYPRTRWTVAPLEDTFGRSVEAGVDALVLSADTLAGGHAVNAERRRRGRRAVPLLVVPLALGDDLQPVSSRRIRAGTIDRRGRRLGPIRVALAVEHPKDRSPALRAIRRSFRRARFVAGGSELTVSVRGRDAAHRTVTLATPSTALEPVTLGGRFPVDLARLLVGVLRRSSTPKPFKSARR
jgi:cytidyltransferase-like protein